MTEPIYSPYPFAELIKHWFSIKDFEESARIRCLQELIPSAWKPEGELTCLGSGLAKLQYETFCRRLGIDIQPQEPDNSPTPTIEGEQNAVTTLRSIQQQKPE